MRVAIILVAIMSGLIFCPFLHATEWGLDTRLTYDPGYSANGQNGIAVGPSNYVHICWMDNRNGNQEVYYKQSTDGGETWSGDIRLTDNPLTDNEPAIICNDNKVHTIWVRGGTDVYYRCSTDGGETWLPEKRLYTGGLVQSPCIAVDGDTIYSAWVRILPGPPFPALLRRSFDGGETWLDPINVAPPGYDTCGNCDLLIDGAKRVHFFWTNSAWLSYPDWELYTRKSTDFGNTWSYPPVLIDTNIYRIISIEMEVATGPDANVLHIAWLGVYTGATFYDLVYKRSSDAGETWNQYFDKWMGASWTPWGPPDVAVTNATGEVHLVWEDKSSSPSDSGEILYNCSTDNGLTWGTDERLTYDDAISTIPSINGDGSLYLIWSDTRDGNYEIYYKKNTTGIEEKSKVQNLSAKSQALEIYPNPFTGHIVIDYALNSRHYRENNNKLPILRVYDASGQLVKQFNHLTNRQFNQVLWNGTDDAGHRLPAGIYFVQIETDGYTDREKVILFR
jgi:hypothetical protein